MDEFATEPGRQGENDHATRGLPRPVPKLSLSKTPEVPTAFRGFALGVLGRPETFWTRAEREGTLQEPLYMFLYMFGFVISVKSSADLPQIDELFPRSSPNQ